MERRSVLQFAVFHCGQQRERRLSSFTAATLQERLIFIRLLALKRLKAPGWRGADRLILYHTSKQTNRPSTTFDGAPWWISPFVTQAGGPKLRWRTISVCVENKNKNIYIYMWIQPNRDRIMNATCWSGGPLERKTARVSRCCCC